MQYMKRILLSVITWAILGTFLTGGFCASASGLSGDESGGQAVLEAEKPEESDGTDVDYSAYLQQYASVLRPAEGPLVEALALWEQNTTAGGQLDPSLREGGALVFDSDTATVEYTVTLEQAGLYRMELFYQCLDTFIRDTEISVRINGKYPFHQAQALIIPKHYVNAQQITQDNRGNDMRPSTAVSDGWISCTLRDASGLEGDYLFYLPEGTSRITLEFGYGKIALGYIRLYNPSSLVPYADYLRAHPEKSTGVSREIQGENPLYRSSSVICLNYDRSGPQVTPCDAVALKLNTIGGSGWSEPNQYVAWNVHVEKAGLYRLQIRYRQNVARGRPSFRRLYINGTVPFAEADVLPFGFSDSWQTDWLGDEEPYLFYLKAGDNELRLEAVCGDFVPIIQKASGVSENLGEVYKDIIMVTGMNPDPNRDYMLTDEIPTLIDRCGTLIADLDELEQLIQQIGSHGLSDDAATIRTLRVQLEGFIDAPSSIAMRVTNFQSNISAFSDFVAGLKSQPLEIDRIGVTSPELPGVIEEPGFWAKASFQLEAFIGSFFNDYASVGSIKENGERIEVWVDFQSGSVGRDHAQTIMQVTDGLFTPQTGIGVNIKLVQQALAPAILSGIGPDVAMYVGASEPVNLAARGGLVDLKHMEGFDEFTQEFRPGAFTPFTYNGGVYGVPFTQSFPMLFCRTDILEELGLTPPSTWEEFYEVLEEIQKNNMAVGIPNMTSGAMSTDNTIFAMFLYQNGGEYYNEDLSETRFDEEVAVDAFRQWTDLYKNYGLPVSFSFYQRFRLGDMPMAIEGYSMYNMLRVAAPEIEGLWDVYPIPGVLREDGTICNTAIASGMGTVILSVTEKAESAWQYVKWLSGTQAQTQISLELEAILGPTGRLSPANVEAFDNLPWDKAASAKIKSQWEQVAFIPQVPGNYYVERNLTNAFRKTVFYRYNYREALLEYNREMNIEIARKRKEFHLD